MEGLARVLELVSPFVYGGLAVAALRQWFKHRSAATAWLTVMFGALGWVVIVGRLLPEDSTSEAVVWIQRVNVAILILFPYSLWRFHHAFCDAARWAWVFVHVLTAIVLVGAFFVDLNPEEEPSGLTRAWVYLLLFLWTFLSVRVAVRLWRAGRNQAGVARRRMQLLGAGAVALAIALLVAGLAPQSGDEASEVSVATQLTGFASAGLFLIGLTPPGVVRLAWRRPEEERLREAEVALMRAETPKEVADTLLPHVARLVGASATALLDKRFEVIASVGDPDEVESAVERVKAHARDHDAGQEAPNIVRLESGWLVVVPSRFSPFFGREESELSRTLALMADLALGRTKLLEDLGRSNAELEQFAYVASHDLQEPLRTVSSYASLLSRRFEGQLDEKADKYIHYVTDGCDRMQDLINDLLLFSRAGRAVEPGPVEVRVALDRALANISGAVQEAGARIEIGDLPVVHADEAELVQLFQNLLSNSIKYRNEDREPVIEVSAGSIGAHEWVLTVSDNGIGIDPKYADRIFTIFQRLHTRREYPGTGIGLAVCKKIVEKQGGRIWLDPFSGEGAAFHFTLPAARTDQK